MAGVSTKERKKPFRAGGAATAGGMNFQSSVTAIAYVHIEAIAAKKYLLAGHAKEGDWGHSPLHQLSQVDCPDLDWSQIRETYIDTANIEEALYHPSQWIVWMAATILEHKLDPGALKACVRRLLAEGEGYTLWAAGGLAAEIPGREGTDLVVARLKQEFKWGERHLFDMLCLSKHRPLCSGEDMMAILENGLFANVWPAQSAAELLLKVAEPAKTEFLSLIESALDHWLEHEEPYPKAGGAIPKSPRADLAKARVAIEGPVYRCAKAYLDDVRSDMCDVGKSSIIGLFEAEDSALVEFFADVESGQIDAPILSFVLDKLDSLAAGDTGQVAALLDHDDERVRFAAMAILDEKYLDPDQMRGLLKKLQNDKIEDIRERAKDALAKLNWKALKA